MEQFPTFLIPSEKDNFSTHYTNYLITIMRKEITETLLKNNDDKDHNQYYDLDAFFKQHNIKSIDTQQLIKKTIFDELKNIGWVIATIFGDTGLIILKTKQEIEKCVWASSFDFTIQ
jgi:hypothetical protein